MWPGASVSGWYFSHPQSQYFVVGRLGRDQVEEYATRKGWTLAEAERWLGPNLGYRAGGLTAGGLAAWPPHPCGPLRLGSQSSALAHVFPVAEPLGSQPSRRTAVDRARPLSGPAARIDR